MKETFTSEELEMLLKIVADFEGEFGPFSGNEFAAKLEAIKAKIIRQIKIP